jgi:hypothetical protein
MAENIPGITNLDQGQTNSILGSNIFNTNTIGSIANQYKLNTAPTQAFQVSAADTPNTSDQNRNIANAVYKFNNDILNTQTSQINNAANRQINTTYQQAADANAQNLSAFGSGFLNPQDSQLNRSNLTNNNVRFTNAVYDINSKAQDSIGQIAMASAQNNIQAYQQMRANDFQDRQQQFSEDRQLGAETGNLYNKGTTAGVRNMSGKSNDFTLASNYSAQTGFLQDMTNFGQSSFNPFKQTENLTVAGNAAKQQSEINDLGTIDLKGKLGLFNNYTTDKSGRVTLNSNYTQDSYNKSLVGQGMQSVLDTQTMQRKDLQNQIDTRAYAQSENVDNRKYRDFQNATNMELAQIELDNSRGTPGAGEALTAEYDKQYQTLVNDPNATDAQLKTARVKREEAALKNYIPLTGTNQGTLYSGKPDGKDGYTYTVNDADVTNQTTKALSKYGLDLNGSYPTVGTPSSMKSAEAAKTLINNQLLKSLSSGDSSTAINKLFIESNPDDKTQSKLLLGLKANDGNKDLKRYNWQEIDLGKMTERDRIKFTSAVKEGVLDPVNFPNETKGTLDILDKIIANTPGASTKISAGDGFNDTSAALGKMMGDKIYSQAANNTSFDFAGVGMNSKQLLGYISAGTQRGGESVVTNPLFSSQNDMSIFMSNFVEGFRNNKNDPKLAFDLLSKSSNPNVKKIANSLSNYKNGIEDPSQMFFSLKPLFDATLNRQVLGDEFAQLINGVKANN